MKTESFNIQEYLESKAEITQYEKDAILLIDTFSEKYKNVLKDYHSPDFLLKMSGFQVESEELITELSILAEECRKLIKQEKTILFLKESSRQLFELLNKAYPFECKLPAVHKKTKDYEVLKFKTTDEVVNHLLVVINKVFLLNRAGTLLSLRNPDFLNLDALVNLLDGSTAIDELWLRQLLHCLCARDFVENSRLIRQTPAFMMDFAGKLFTELHGLSIDKIKKA